MANAKRWRVVAALLGGGFLASVAVIALRNIEHHHPPTASNLASSMGADRSADANCIAERTLSDGAWTYKLADGNTYVFQIPTEADLKVMLEPNSPYRDGLWDGEKEFGVEVWPPVNDGMLLIAGRYSPPPYRLARLGASIFVNGRLARYAWFWREAGPVSNPERHRVYITENLRDDAGLIIRPLTEGKIVNIAYRPEENVRLWDVTYWYELTEKTLQWADMLMSDKPNEEKCELQTSFPTVGHFFERADFDRFMESDRSPFIARVKLLVEQAQKRREEEERKFSGGLWPQTAPATPEPTESPKATPSPTPGRPGYVYVGKDKAGRDVFFPKEPVLDGNTRGTMLVCCSDILRASCKDTHGRPYFPGREWYAKKWRPPEKDVADWPEPWWFNGSGESAGSQWFAQPWEKRDSSYVRVIGLDGVLNGNWKVMIHNVSMEPVSPEQSEALAKPDSHVKVFPFYQFRAIMVVPESSPLKEISGPQMSDLFASKQVPAFLRAAGYSQATVTYCHHTGWRHLVHLPVVWGAKLRFGELTPSDRTCESLPMDQFITRLKNDRWAIGIVLVQPDLAKQLTGLRVLAVSPSGKEEAVLPSLDPVIQEDYALNETMKVFIRDDAPQWVHEVLNHFGAAEFAEHVWPEGIITPATSGLFKADGKIGQTKLERGTSATATTSP